MVEIERAAAAHRRRALAAFECGAIAQARELADRACALHRSADALAARALVALAEGRHALAFELARGCAKAARPRPVMTRRRAGFASRADYNGRTMPARSCP